MRYIYIAIALLIGALTITACSNSTAPEEDVKEEIEEPSEYPMYVDTWRINDPRTADWIGNSSNSNSKADTLLIDSPDGYYIGIEDDSTYTYDGDNLGKFEFTFHDSTMTFDIYKENNVDRSEIYSGLNFGNQGASTSVTAEGFRFSTFVFYNCLEEPEEVALEFVFYKEDGSVFRVYQFDVSGFTDTIEHISC